MNKTINGFVMFAAFETEDEFLWRDPETNQEKPIRSLKVLVAHGDGTISRESIGLARGASPPALSEGEAYGFPCLVRFNAKRQVLQYTLRTDLAPFPAPVAT